jgi:isoquinoline 1-oxidoreductase subunit alpha
MDAKDRVSFTRARDRVLSATCKQKRASYTAAALFTPDCISDEASSNEEWHMARLNINGETRELDVDPSTPLLWVLREQAGLTGTKYGCGIAVCGACTVQIDGVATRSCVLPVSGLTAEQKIVTIEGLSKDGSHPLQKAWLAHDVPQCGYCQSGMLMAAAGLLRRNPNPTDQDIDAEITNICRCGTYNRVRAAIKTAAATKPGSTSSTG